MAKLITPLSDAVPIVRSDGTPTPYFCRLLADISDAKISAGVIEAMGGDPDADMVVVWDDAIGDLAFLSVEDMLDWISGTQGSILYRNATEWVALSPGDAGQVLTSGGSGANPSWEDAATGGAGYEASPTVPATSSFTLQNAGTASMSDASNSRGIILTCPSVANQIRFIRKNGSPPSAPYTITTRHTWITAGSTTGIYKSCIILRNNTSGRIIIFGDYNSGQILAQRWSSYTAFNANIIAPGNEWAMVDMPWRRVVNNGTTLTFGLSKDGENWHDYSTTEAIATYINAAGGTIDEIGFGTMVNSPGFTNRILFNSFTAA